jgi:hypothetical protein
VTTGSLFEDMIDLAALAEFPDPGYRMVQYSSYDRRSRVPGGPDWIANGDGFGGESAFSDFATAVYCHEPPSAGPPHSEK